MSVGMVNADAADQDRASLQRRTLAVLSAASVLSGIGIAGAVPAGSLLAASVAQSEAVAGLAQTSGTVGAAVVALPLARLALSRGRRSALTTGFAIGAFGAALVIVAAVLRLLPLLLVGTLLVGSASAAGFQARYAGTDLAAPERRARSLAVVVWSATIGSVLGPNLLNASGQLGMALGLPQLAGPYVVAGGTLLIAALVLFALLRPDPYQVAVADRAGGAPRVGLRSGLAHLRTRPAAMLGIATVAVGHVVMVAIMVMTPVHMAHVDVTLQVIGLVISVHIAGMYALSPVVGWVVDRVGRRPAAGIGVAILLASCAITGAAPAHDSLILGAGLFLLGLGWSFTLIAGSTMVIDAVDADERPAVQGLSDLVMNVAGAFGGIVAGVVVFAWSYTALTALAALPLIALALVLPRVGREQG